MRPSEALAATVVDELVRVGVRHVVLCPGSRSAPLAYASAEADRRGRLTLHVRVDERSAAFLALGLGAASGVPAAVVTTSGTAVANLHPAVLEASEAGVPLLLVTADRPPELRGTRANQTTDQVKIFGAAVRWAHDLGAPEADDIALRAASWRTAVDRAVAAARGDLGSDPGPVQLNVPLRDPLAPAGTGQPRPDAPADAVRAAPDAGRPGEAAGDRGAASRSPSSDPADGSATVTAAPAAQPDPLAGRPGDAPWVSTYVPPVGAQVGTIEHVARTLVVLGDTTGGAGGVAATDALARATFAVARRHGWPVVAEPFGPGRRDDTTLVGPLLPHEFVAAHAPDRILVVGRVTLSRSTAALLRTPGVTVDLVTPRPAWPDPGHVVHRVHTATALLALADEAASPGAALADDAFSGAFARAARAVGVAVRPALAASWPSGPALADVVLRAIASDARPVGVVRDGEPADGYACDGTPDASGSATPPVGEAVDQDATHPGEQVADADARAAESVLFVGSSNSARDVELARSDTAPTVRANRGLAGIDGCLATAIGHALARPEAATYALVGDLTFLHDSGALAIGPGEPQPDLTIVVADDDGGGIFSTLEYGHPERVAADEGAFERVFATPTGTRIADLCRAHGVEHELATHPEAVRAALAGRPRGLKVVQVPLPRASHRDVRAQLEAAAAAGALSSAEQSPTVPSGLTI